MLTDAADGGKAAEGDRNRFSPAGALDPHRVDGGARRGIRRRDAQSSLLCLEWATP